MEKPQKKCFSPLEWSDFEYNYYQKDSNWYWYVASGALLIIIAAVLMRNFLFAALAVAAAFAVIMFGAQKPKKVNFYIDARGIGIGRHIHAFSELKSFWIHYDPPAKKELILESNRKLLPLIKIPLGDTDPNAVREFLIKMLKEKKQEESLLETIAERLGF